MPTHPEAKLPVEMESVEMESVEDLRDAVVALVARWGYDRREKPFRLSSSGVSRDYIDGKRAIAQGNRLLLVGQAIAAVARSKGVSFKAAGGLTMGADPLAVAVSVATDCMWFSVRKEEKAHGKQKKIEGAELTPGTEVLLVDDVATTGRSMIEALDVLESYEVKVVLAIPMIDRGDLARESLESRGVIYEPVITYRDLGIEPTHRGREVA